MLPGCFWLTVILPPSSTQGKTPLLFFLFFFKTGPNWLSKRPSLSETRDRLQVKGLSEQQPRASPASPTGRWQIRAPLPTATVFGCGISREASGGRGVWGGGLMTEGSRRQELKSCPEARRTADVMEDVCDRGWAEGYPPVSPQTNLQEEPYMGNNDVV